ncbi:MAG TPA: response regulator transcription factor [Nitrospiria bacterium]|jgi:DNA-binding response OmpR family regulator|nr:response regulator transcription factor [Nitrospiria bacterium]
MKATVLIIDDDAKLNQLLVDFLGDYGFNVLTAARPDEGLRKLKQQVPDLIILDVMLPGMSGFEVCKLIRRSYTVPIIMLTARGLVTDKIVGLELGADDYLPKPFEPRELVARIQSVLRRARGGDEPSVKKFGRLEVDFSKRSAKLDGALVDLTTNEFAALALMVKNSGKVLNRDQILQELRGMEYDAFNRSVDITMSRLRHKLRDDPKNPSFIKTVWGTGYVFIAGEEPDGE